MALSGSLYTGDGGTSTFNITFPFIERTHVQVHVNRLLLTTSEWKFVTDSQIQIIDTFGQPAPPGVNDAIVVRRQTSIATRLVVFQPGSVLTENDLNLANLQNFYLVQEATENLTDLYDNAIARIATEEGIVDVDGEDTVMNEVVASIIDSEVAATIQAAITDIDTNAQELLVHLGLIDEAQEDAEAFATAADVSLQAAINALAGSIASAAFVQDDEPVPGVGDVPDPIIDTSRWYDSDDDQHPYIWLPTNLTNATYKWTAAQNSGEFYVELTGGGDPGFVEPPQVEEDDSYLTGATQPLSTGEWEWADGGGGFSTIIVRLSDSADPDSKASGFVEMYDWLDLLDPRIGVNAVDITNLEATVNDGSTGVAANAAAIVVTDATAVTLDGVVVAIAADVVTLEATVDGVNGVVANASAVSSLQTQVTSNDGELSANASNITTLIADLDTEEAALISELTVRADADSLMAADLTLLGVHNIALDAFILNTSAIELDSEGGTLLQTRISNIVTHSGQFARTTESTLNTAVENAETGITDLEAHYGVTLNVNDYITGFTLLNDGSTGTFGILTDKFLIVDPANNGQNPKLVFSIVAGVVRMINVEILGSLVVAGTITSTELTTGAFVTTTANISAAVIETANIKDLNVTGAKIADLTVDSLQIKGNAVTIPTSAYTDAITSQILPSAGWTTVQSVTFTSTGAPCFITWSMVVSGQPSSTRFEMSIRIMEDGGSALVTYPTLEELESGVLTGIQTGNLAHTFSSGSVTVQIQVDAGDDADWIKAQTRSLMCLETKK